MLVLYDENTDFPGLAQFDQSLKAAFKAGATDRIDLYTESMDLARCQDDRYMQVLRAFYALCWLKAACRDTKIIFLTVRG